MLRGNFQTDELKVQAINSLRKTRAALIHEHKSKEAICRAVVDMSKEDKGFTALSKSIDSYETLRSLLDQLNRNNTQSSIMCISSAKLPMVTLSRYVSCCWGVYVCVSLCVWVCVCVVYVCMRLVLRVRLLSVYI